ncbi:hypothetical protein PENSPDRAFT_620827, partial [Peniophora sp. CONT]
MSDDKTFRLSGSDDWPLFRVKAKAKLRREGVWTIVEQAVKIIDASTASIASGSSPTQPVPTSVDDLSSAQPAPRSASPTSSSAAATTAPQMDYEDEILAGSLWVKLRRRFEEQNRGDAAMTTLTDLFRTKLVVGDNSKVDHAAMETHVTAIKGYLDRLKRLKYGLAEDLQPLILLSTMPDDEYWTGIRGNIVSSSGAGLTWDVARNKLFAVAPRTAKSDESALSAKERPPARSARDKYCMEHGKNRTHNTEDCRTIKETLKEKAAGRKGDDGGGGQSKRSKRPRGRANRASAATDSESESDDEAHGNVATVSRQSYRSVSAYIARDAREARTAVVLDSGASTTMTPHAEWFETGSYRRLDPPRRVRLGNDSFCDAVGTGIVRLSCKTKRGPCDVA